MCALSETKLRRKGKVVFDDLAERVSGVQGGRVREGVLLLSRWLLRCVVEWKEISSRLMLVR